MILSAKKGRGGGDNNINSRKTSFKHAGQGTDS